MKKLRSIALSSIFMGGLFLISCGEDDSGTTIIEGPELTGESKTYTLTEVETSGISGTVKLEEYDDESTKITLNLTGTSADNNHPSHIHLTSDGSISISLTTVDGSTGESVTEVSATDAEMTITYSELVALNGYVNVHQSSSDLSVVATGGLGGFEEEEVATLTRESETYDLAEVEESGISGTVKLEEYSDESTKITISLTGTFTGSNHPAHIHLTSDGSISISLTSIDGSTGESVTEVSATDAEVTITYSELVALNGYVNVHQSSTDPSVVATGGLGGFEEASDVINYDVTNSGASAYLFTGEGLSNSSNPNITLKRGTTYTFTVNAPGHPFLINSTQGTGTGNQYSDGVTGNGATSGTVTFVVPANAPSTLFYNCQHHASMTGTITITD